METVAPYQEIIGEVKKAGGDAAKYCYQCGKCDVVCPWNRVRAFSIRRLVRQASFGLPDIEQDDLWRCTTCGTCPAACPRGVRQIEVGVSLRRLATGYGVFPESAAGAHAAAASVLAEGNPLGMERGRRDAWASGLGVKPFAEGMEILFFVGCYGSYDPRMKKVSAAIARILERAGVDYGILGEQESCCGESVRKAGDEEAFKKVARANIKAFVDRGVRRILVASPHCYQAFKHEYADFMVRLEVVHLAQYLKELIDAGRLRLTRPLARKVTFHDPCYLGRHNGIFDEPREVLTRIAGVDLREMADHHQASLCCGGGGGRIWMDTPKHERFADLRVAQAQAVGAEVLVTACPYCISNFEESRLSLEGEGALEIKDLAEVVADAL